MMLLTLIQKGGLWEVATAIPATVATEGAERPETVARVATVAVASVPLRRAFDRDAFEERAAILEYDGGLTRNEAEELAANAQGFTAADARRLLH